MSNRTNELLISNITKQQSIGDSKIDPFLSKGVNTSLYGSLTILNQEVFGSLGLEQEELDILPEEYVWVKSLNSVTYCADAAGNFFLIDEVLMRRIGDPLTGTVLEGWSLESLIATPIGILVKTSDPYKWDILDDVFAKTGQVSLEKVQAQKVPEFIFPYKDKLHVICEGGIYVYNHNGSYVGISDLWEGSLPRIAQCQQVGSEILFIQSGTSDLYRLNLEGLTISAVPLYAQTDGFQKFYISSDKTKIYFYNLTARRYVSLETVIEKQAHMRDIGLIAETGSTLKNPAGTTIKNIKTISDDVITIETILDPLEVITTLSLSLLGNEKVELLTKGSVIFPVIRKVSGPVTYVEVPTEPTAPSGPSDHPPVTVDDLDMDRLIERLDTKFTNDMWRRNIDINGLESYSVEVVEGDPINLTMGSSRDNLDSTINYVASGTPDITQNGANLIFLSDDIRDHVITVVGTGSLGGTSTSTITVTVIERINTAPQYADIEITILQGRLFEKYLGDLIDIDDDVVTFTVTSSESFTQVTNQLSYQADNAGTFTFNVAIIDSALLESSYTITLIVLAELPDGVSNYIFHKNIIPVDYGTGIPAKFESFVEPTSGSKITRLTDSSVDMEQTSSAVNGYSRYTQENSDGSMYLAVGTNSTSCTIFNSYSGEVIGHLAKDGSGLGTKTLGMFHELRWDKTGNHPKRMYYRDGTSFFKFEDVTQNTFAKNDNLTRTLIKDFEPLINWPAGATNARRVYNDQEGDSSDDSDHWAFMAAWYDGSNFKVAAIIHYQISTDTTHVLYPSDFADTPLDMIKNDISFPQRPNMVEVSPLGTGIVIHNGRSFSGHNMHIFGTWLDGPHLWPLDFDVVANPPFRISITETHSGWAYAEDGRELFVYQDNRRDMITATYISGPNKGYGLSSTAGRGDEPGEGSIDFADHTPMNWTGLHFARMPPSKKGWIMVSTYRNNGTSWADNQLMMMQIKDWRLDPKVWRVTPMINAYTGDYFDEAPGSINLRGDSIFVSQNWGAGGGLNELYRMDMPRNWDQHLDELFTKYGQNITIDNIELL